MWIETATQYVLRTPADVRARFPGVSFPAVLTDETLAAFGLVPLRSATPPAHDPMTHVVTEAVPVEVDGQWTRTWTLAVRDTATVRGDLHAARRAARTAAETGGFWFNGHPVDSDRDSILRLNNAATTAITASLASAPFATTWKCADDYEMLLDASGIMALQAALSAHGQACHERSQALGALIDDSQADFSAVAAEMSGGWPPR